MAKLGEVQDTLSAVGAADEEFSHARPPRSAVDGLLHRGPPYRFLGNVLWELGMHGQFVAETRNRLTAGIVARIRDQLRLASLIMTTDDPTEAALGTQALDWAGPVRSRRAADDLRELRRVAEPHARLSEVAELRQRIGTVVAA